MPGNRFDILFEPVKIGPVTAPNRFYAVPHATGHGRAEPNGSIALRAMKAEGGWGVVAMQMTEIGPDSDMGNHPMDRLWDGSDELMHAHQVEAIKAHGALAAIELAHGGMRARNLATGLPVIGPSDLPVLRPEVPVQARAMDISDIRAFRKMHKSAAKRAKDVGYDILYVYAAHDLSLLSHFLSRRTNSRSDAYGGSLVNRTRLLREVLEDTLETAAGEVAVALRFSVSEPDKQVGLKHDGEGREVVETLAELPDLWDVNIAGWPQDSATSRFADEGFQLPFTDFVKSVTSKPVVGVGRFTSPDLMVSLVRKRRLDLIGAARPSIADPFLPAKIRDGKPEDIRECIGCNVCVSMDGYGLPLRCTQNPTIAEEWRRGWHPETIRQSSEAKSHLIVGAGPAGLECAWTLLRAGHKVTIAEAASEPGGRVSRESRLPGLSAWGRVRDYRVQQISQSPDADLYLSSRMAVEDIVDFGAASVVIAAGSRWRFDGIGSTRFSPVNLSGVKALTPDNIMDNAASFKTGSGGFVVYDDDHFYMASVVAEKLSLGGHAVAYVTPLPTVATWTGFTLEQARIVDRLNDLGVQLFVNTSLEDGMSFSSTLTGNTVDVPGDHLVLVGSREPNNELHKDACTRLGEEMVVGIGDCLVPGSIQAAVHSGHRAARRLLGDRLSEGAFNREIARLL